MTVGACIEAHRAKIFVSVCTVSELFSDSPCHIFDNSLEQRSVELCPPNLRMFVYFIPHKFMENTRSCTNVYHHFQSQ